MILNFDLLAEDKSILSEQRSRACYAVLLRTNTVSAVNLIVQKTRYIRLLDDLAKVWTDFPEWAQRIKVMFPKIVLLDERLIDINSPADEVMSALIFLRLPIEFFSLLDKTKARFKELHAYVQRYLVGQSSLSPFADVLYMSLFANCDVDKLYSFQLAYQSQHNPFEWWGGTDADFIHAFTNRGPIIGIQKSMVEQGGFQYGYGTLLFAKKEILTASLSNRVYSMKENWNGVLNKLYFLMTSSGSVQANSFLSSLMQEIMRK